MNDFIKNIQDFFKRNSIFTNLIAINVAVFLFIQALHIVAFLMSQQSALLMDSNFGADRPWLKLTWYYLGTTSDLADLVTRPWSVITYMFTHEGLMHLAGNLITFYFFGRYLFQFLGGRKLLSTYLLGGLSGWLFYVVSYNVFPGLAAGASGSMIGASASVLACLVAAATYSPRQVINLFYFKLEFRYLAGILVLLDFLALDDNSNTGGHIAHIGGAAFGFLMIKQLQQGRDINKWLENLLDRFFNLFKKNPKMRVVHKRSKAAEQTDEEYNQDKANAQQKVDRILDKIAKGGYSSLTKGEKEFLNKYSSK